jgi:hypothetical protein
MEEMKLLLTGVFGPYGKKDRYAEGLGMQMELLNNQITRQQGSTLTAAVLLDISPLPSGRKYIHSVSGTGLPFMEKIQEGTEERVHPCGNKFYTAQRTEGKEDG